MADKPSTSRPPPTSRSSRKARFDTAGEDESSNSDSDTPPTPTFSELRRNLSFATIKEIELYRKQVKTKKPHPGPKDVDQLIAYAVTGGTSECFLITELSTLF